MQLAFVRDFLEVENLMNVVGMFQTNRLDKIIKESLSNIGISFESAATDGRE